jgi:hypothetical protein
MTVLVAAGGLFLGLLGFEVLLIGGAWLWGRRRDRTAVDRLEGMIELEALWRLPAREPRRTA